MTKTERILILSGSPKKDKSTTHSISEFLQNEFYKKGISSEIAIVSSYLKDEIQIKELIALVDSCNILFIISPLYIDSLPYNVIQALELIKKYSDPTRADKKVIAISHCGLEAIHNRVAIKICESFSKELHYNFAGGVTLGFSIIINGDPLSKLFKMTKNVQKSLQSIVNAVVAGEKVSMQARQLMSQSMLPGPLFLIKILGNRVMNICYKNKSFTIGIKKLQNKLALFYS
jgi:hypothetical protein